MLVGPNKAKIGCSFVYLVLSLVFFHFSFSPVGPPLSLQVHMQGARLGRAIDNVRSRDVTLLFAGLSHLAVIAAAIIVALLFDQQPTRRNLLLVSLGIPVTVAIFFLYITSLREATPGVQSGLVAVSTLSPITLVLNIGSFISILLALIYQIDESETVVLILFTALWLFVHVASLIILIYHLIAVTQYRSQYKAYQRLINSCNQLERERNTRRPSSRIGDSLSSSFALEYKRKRKLVA